MTESISQHIPGADSLVEWFGYWPDLRDGEIVEVHLNRQETSWIKICFFTANGTDDEGCHLPCPHLNYVLCGMEVQLDDSTAR